MKNAQKMTEGGYNRQIISPSGQTLDSLLENCPKNQIIGDNLVRAWAKINSEKYKKIVCSISGGSDSDIMLDICIRCDKDKKIDYVWFDTGLEYQATKDHLKFLKEKYEIEIKEYRAIKPIPTCCREYGQPFLSKNVSNYMGRLQKHHFQWENEPIEILLPKYCKWNVKKQDWVGCKFALKWWCASNGENSRFNITQNKWLKEFIIENPPQFKISNICCQYAKKDVSHKLISEFGYDLNIFGIRKAEGGVRSTTYKSCFDENEDGCDNYRPLFWYKNSDKEDYEQYYGIVHSKCYTEYGLKRTGCAGCPYGRNFEYELDVMKKYEPKLYKAVNNIFGESYEYTRKYKDFCKMMNEKKKNNYI